MDNVNYNFDIITLLYKARKENQNDRRLNKPLLVLLVSVIECMLYDFVVRIQTHTNDLIPNLPTTIIYYFRGIRETDELKVIIEKVRAQNLLRASGNDSIYDDLEVLRKVRNRVHIQNKYHLLERDESDVFTNTRIQLVEQVLERVCGVLCNVYPRWDKQPLSMADFPRPWL